MLLTILVCSACSDRPVYRDEDYYARFFTLVKNILEPPQKKK